MSKSKLKLFKIYGIRLKVCSEAIKYQPWKVIEKSQSSNLSFYLNKLNKEHNIKNSKRKIQNISQDKLGARQGCLLLPSLFCVLLESSNQHI